MNPKIILVLVFLCIQLFVGNISQEVGTDDFGSSPSVHAKQLDAASLRGLLGASWVGSGSSRFSHAARLHAKAPTEPAGLQRGPNLLSPSWPTPDTKRKSQQATCTGRSIHVDSTRVTPTGAPGPLARLLDRRAAPACPARPADTRRLLHVSPACPLRGASPRAS